MSLIPEQQLNEIKSKVDIVTLIGEQIPLKRAGQNWRGHCPFHQEKTPSFMVSPEKQIYHCFGCGEGGNLFNFLMKFEGLNFVEAAEKLADRAGIHLQRQEGAPRVSGEEKEMLFRINRFAARVFAQNLQDPEKGKRGQKYLVSRGVLPETIQKYELGLALPGYENLAGRLEGKKIPPTYAEKVGLIRQKENRYYDFFRDRLIFPIVAASGQVIGFGGRILEDEPGQAKYINSSDSMIYNKSESVFGLNLAKQAIRQQDAVILVEGYLDQIILHQAGFENVVAPLGTALTEAQIRTLSRFTKNFILLLDGDEAGQKACRRALPLFLKQGIFAKTVVLPPEADPDSFVREKGKEALASLLKEAVPLFDSFMQSVMVGVESNTQGKMKAVQTIFPVLQLLTAGIEKDLYVQRVASFLHLSEGEVRKELNLFEKKGATFHPLS
ncbi:MAG: DNA primase, partial [bacterium]|nr:DNA primase [bacterium]